MKKPEVKILWHCPFYILYGGFSPQILVTNTVKCLVPLKKKDVRVFWATCSTLSRPQNISSSSGLREKEGEVSSFWLSLGRGQSSILENIYHFLSWKKMNLLWLQLSVDFMREKTNKIKKYCLFCHISL
jgi:hypothetical protein